jgi:hypothetical protein
MSSIRLTLCHRHLLHRNTQQSPPLPTRVKLLGWHPSVMTLCLRHLRHRNTQQSLHLPTRLKLSEWWHSAIVPAYHLLRLLLPPTCSHSQQARAGMTLDEPDLGRRLIPMMTWPTKLQHLPGPSTAVTPHIKTQGTRVRLCSAFAMK